MQLLVRNGAEIFLSHNWIAEEEGSKQHSKLKKLKQKW